MVVLDGYGISESQLGNPIYYANIPTLKYLDNHYHRVLLQASGLSVGLPWGVFGNSEVGHQTMGSGQIMYHFMPTITAAMQSGLFYKNKALLSATEWANKNNSKLHLIGLTSDGGVHSHINHLAGLVNLAKKEGVKEVCVHAITDGRDTSPNSSQKYIKTIEAALEKNEIGKLATITGRFYSMDRNLNWDRIEKAFVAYSEGKGALETDPYSAIEKQYHKGVYDEYLKPIVMVDENGKPKGLIEDNDAIIFYNFRADRARQITEAFTAKDFKLFKAAKRPKNLNFVGFTRYRDDLPAKVAFPPQKITTRVADIISRKGYKQLRIAETEKFAHVTYFFNGGLSEPFPGEDRIFVPSKNAPSYASVPEMSAKEVTEKLIKAIRMDTYDFILVNYANTDMIGHTGDFQASIKTLEVIDGCLNDLIANVLDKGGCLLITADHGNIEEMINLETGEIDTQHTVNPVPFWFVSGDKKSSIKLTPSFELDGMIADVAPTILELFNIEKPARMIGDSLFDRLGKKKKAVD